jgi:hypothetical protein
MQFPEFCRQLEEKIQKSYEEGVTLEQSEKLAGEFLYAQLVVSKELKAADLDARMRKSGTKAVRASAYLEIVQGSEKKPTETQIASMLDVNKLVSQEQDRLDQAEVSRDELERYYDVFQNAHVHFRTIAKGRFDG